MRVQPHNGVKLLSTYPDDTPETPIWGGRFGMLSGTVTKCFTHKHDPSEHRAQVEWSNGKTIALGDEHLSFLSESERLYSMLWKEREGIANHDVYVLIRTDSGRFVLNYIESSGAGMDDYKHVGARDPYFAGMTKYALSDVKKPDADLFQNTVAYPDWVEKGTKSMFQSQCEVYKFWGVPIPPAFYHPLPEFPNLEAAIKSCPQEAGAAISMFRLPNNVCEYLTLSTLGS